MFAAELGRSVGRLDWWNIKAEHSPYTWAVQRAMARLLPLPDRRSDLRAAHNTAMQIAATRAGETSAEELNELRDYLRTYLRVHEDSDEVVDLDALAKLKERQHAGDR